MGPAQPKALIEVTTEVIEEARLALLDFLIDLSPAGIVEGWEWEDKKGPAVVYLERDGSAETLRAIERYLQSLTELWGGGAVLRYEVRDIACVDWRTAHQRYFTAQRITDRITVAPPWEAYDDAGPGEIVVRILPGPAFGTGAHETTRLCLEALDAITRKGPIASLLDVGCGSGILAVAGVMLGIGRAVGVESDPDAVRSAVDNVERNGVAGRVEVFCRTFAEPIGTFDVVCANLTASEITGLIVPLSRSLAPQGTLILSGILVEERQRMAGIIGAHFAAGAREISVRQKGEWVSFEVADKSLERRT
jgi:ribosomal protein L11 methyltransferase